MLKSKSKIRIFDVAVQSGWKEPKVLIWRDSAKHIRPLFLQFLYKNGGLVCELDFSGVETADGSFIDELIVTELRKIEQHKADMRCIYMSNLSPVTLFNADLVFAKKRSPDERFHMLVRLEGGKWKLLSEGLEASLKETLVYVMEEEQVTSNDVAKRFEVSIPAASVRLKNLYDLRLLYRTEETTKTGKEFIYEGLF
jgi:hypothetical protein